MRKWPRSAPIALVLVAALAFAVVACNGDDDDAPTAATSAPTQVATSAPTVAATATATASPAPADDHADEHEERHLTAAVASISLDGKMDDWADIEGMDVHLTAIPEEFREEASAAADMTATLKVATDGANIYVLVAIADGFNYDPENHRLSPALGVQWAIDADAGPHMGTTAPDFDTSAGMVDIWHWELDCPPGELSGGTFPSGNDPECNLDDEYASLTDEREDD
ncbi:MAG: hypothetical protein V3S31_05805, partial [Dehalococcoidia bacterium]